MTIQLHPTAKYITQVWKAINHCESLLIDKAVILIGDFNSNTIWDYKKHRLSDHSSIVKYLEERKLFSTYHINHKQIHGKKVHAIYYMYWHKDKAYHIDYCFVSVEPEFSTLYKIVEIGLGRRLKVHII